MNDLIAELEKQITGRASGSPSPEAAFQLLHKGTAFIYQRQSSYEQKRRNIWSQHVQDDLAEKAKQDGYPEELIIVEKRDLGISGRKTEQERPGLAYLISLTKQGRVESVWVVACDRLYRDMEYENADRMANLFRKHGIVVCTPYRRYSLKVDDDYDDFHDEMSKVTRENRRRTIRFTATRRAKAEGGLWPGTPVPAGFIVVKGKDDPDASYDLLSSYEPHAEVIPKIFRTYVDRRGSKYEAAKALWREKIVFSFFPKELTYMQSRASLRRTPTNEFGYLITAELIGSIVANPIYIGWWHYAGKIIDRSHHQPLVDRDLFWEAQRVLRNKKPKGRAVRFEPLPFAHLLWCLGHDEAQKITSLNAEGRYVCDYHYKLGITRKCLSMARYQLEAPLLDAIFRQLDLRDYVNNVLTELEEEQRANKLLEAKRHHDIQTLERKLGNLKEGFDEANSKEKRDVIWERIEHIKSSLDELKAAPTPTAKILTSDIDKVREFLGNIETNWQKISLTLQNRLLKLLLIGVYLRHERYTVHATIRWKTGYEQKLTIHRPVIGYCDDTKWREEEVNLLKTLWPSSSRQSVIAAFPQRTWESIACKAQYLGLRRKHMIGEKMEIPRRSRKPKWEIVSETFILSQKESLTR